MRFRDEFPEDCPPPEASEIREPIIVYRLTAKFPVTPRDFQSRWQRDPAPAQFPGARECLAKGLSVFSNLEDAQLALGHRSSGGYVVEIELREGMGAVMQTPSGTYDSHITWWPSIEINYVEIRQRELVRMRPQRTRRRRR